MQIQLLGGLYTLRKRPWRARPESAAPVAACLLLLHRNAPQSRQQIAFHFWPDSTETQALSNLRNLLLTLRRVLPDSERYLTMESRTLQWQDGRHLLIDVDATPAGSLLSARGITRPHILYSSKAPLYEELCNKEGQSNALSALAVMTVDRTTSEQYSFICKALSYGVN